MKRHDEIPGHGAWLEMETLEDAALAQRVSHTLIGHFWSVQGGGATPTRWFVLVNDPDAPTIGYCAVAARPRDASQEAHVFPGCGYVLGHDNGDAYPEFSEEIAALANALDLEIVPNKAGVARDPVETRPAPA